MSDDELEALAVQVEKLNKYGTVVVDVLCEIALFEPDEKYSAIRANNAGTKVIYTDRQGNDDTYWPQDWTVAEQRKSTAVALRARKKP